MHHYRQKENGMYILSRNDIEQIATDKLKEFSPSNLEHPIPLRTTEFLEDYLGLVIKYKYICDFQSGILGLTVMGDEIPIPTYDEFLRPIVTEETYGTVLISPCLRGRNNETRRRYTETHEGSHAILHPPFFLFQERNAITTKNDDNYSFVACRKIELHNQKPKTDSDWLEFQADALAAALLMPRDIFCSYVKSVLRKHSIHTNYIHTHPHINDYRLYSVISEVAKTFSVSYQAARIRMSHLGLLRESN